MNQHNLLQLMAAVQVEVNHGLGWPHARELGGSGQAGRRAGGQAGERDSGTGGRASELGGRACGQVGG